MLKLLAMMLLLPAVSSNGFVYSQQRSAAHNPEGLLSRLPTSLKLKEDKPQKYRLSFDYLNFDTLGNLMNKERVSGDYTRALPGGMAKWNNVRIAHGKGFNDPYPEGESQKYMEGFAYRSSVGDDMFKEQFFAGFPQTEIKTKNLVWDMEMIEQFSWDYFNKLDLNKPYAVQSEPQDVPLAGSGRFQNRRIVLTWIGLSRRNNETCAVIQYQAFANKFNTSMGTMTFQGRSHYWGDIWVSLADKQIEYANLSEDVLVEFTLPGQTHKQIINVLRTGTFDRIE